MLINNSTLTTKEYIITNYVSLQILTTNCEELKNIIKNSTFETRYGTHSNDIICTLTYKNNTNLFRFSQHVRFMSSPDLAVFEDIRLDIFREVIQNNSDIYELLDTEMLSENFNESDLLVILTNESGDLKTQNNTISI